VDAAIFVALIVSIMTAILPMGKQWQAAENKQRERRLAEYRLNARLLRLDI
jgi:hypothetical protein